MKFSPYRFLWISNIHCLVFMQLVKTEINGSVIEVKVTRASSYRQPSTELTVNGQQKSLSKQVLVRQNQQVVALVECTNEQCEIKSSQYGIYVRIHIDRVQVEVSFSSFLLI